MAKEEQSEDVKEVKQEEVTDVTVVEAPSEYGRFFQTPDGIFNQEGYLVWMGNLLLNIKQGVTG